MVTVYCSTLSKVISNFLLVYTVPGAQYVIAVICCLAPTTFAIDPPKLIIPKRSDPVEVFGKGGRGESRLGDYL